MVLGAFGEMSQHKMQVSGILEHYSWQPQKLGKKIDAKIIKKSIINAGWEKYMFPLLDVVTSKYHFFAPKTGQ